MDSRSRPLSAAGDLAGYGPRAAATLLDGLLVGVVAAVVAVAAGVDATSLDSARYLVIGVALLANLVYGPVLMCRSGERNGQTLGKQALSVRVVREDAQPLTASPALLREFVGKGLLGLVPFFTIIDYLFPLADVRRQAIHDKLASTFVVRADAVPDLGPAALDAFGERVRERPRAPEGWAPPTASPPPAPAADDDDEVRKPFGPTR